MWWIANGDSREVLRAMADASVDSVVCDPPYELGFMGKRWDASGIAHDVGLWAEVLRVLKPGGHLLAFGGTRTYHRMACAIEDAGFELRDSLHWIYGSGFPKSLNVSKAIDKAAGAERESVGTRVYADGHIQKNAKSIGYKGCDPFADTRIVTAPATDAAREWSGWGTALKPAHEPIVVARKPLDGTVAANVLAHGTGAINVDATRVRYASESDRAKLAAGVEAIKRRGGTMANSWKNSSDLSGANDASTIGRWPPNILLSHTPDCGDECAEGCAVAEMDGQSGFSVSRKGKPRSSAVSGEGFGMTKTGSEYDDGGGASRFFPVFRYQAKAPRSERLAASDGTRHPTQKPVALMRWLVRLVTPPNGIVLDPFTGSGSTGVAARLEGFRFAGVELSPEYVEIARSRVAHAEASRPNTLPVLGVV